MKTSGKKVGRDIKVITLIPLVGRFKARYVSNPLIKILITGSEFS